MANIARRLVTSNPSSLASSRPSSSVLIDSGSIRVVSPSQINNQLHKRSSNSVASRKQALESDPLRSNNSNQYTAQTISNIRNHEGIESASQISEDNFNKNNKYDNTNKSTVLPKENTTGLFYNGTYDGGGYLSQNISSHPINMTEIESNAAKRERIRVEFYATYDVMTGVRIAATLGGFFGLMVFLIVWKSRSHSNETLKALKDPKTAALAVACMQEEEDRKILEAMDATGLSIFPDEYDAMLFRRQRMMSIGNVSAPPVLHRGFRFSSVGGYSSLLEAPRRFSYSCSGTRRKSTSESSRVLSKMGSSFGTDDFFVETDDELNENEYVSSKGQEKELILNQGYLEVPHLGQQDTRRSSAMTCCSTESSYLERRCSALTLGINNLPPSFRQKPDEIEKPNHGSSSDLWDYYYPDIQIIQPTPKSSPCPSEGDDKLKLISMITEPQSSTFPEKTPLQYQSTIDSCASSLAIDESNSSYLSKNSMSCCYDSESMRDHQLTLTINDSIYSKKDFDYDDNDVVASKIHSSFIVDSKIKNSSNGKSMEQKLLEAVLRSSSIVGTGVGRAPLASCSSFKMSSLDYQDSEQYRSSFNDDDSVFLESFADTDDDLEQFSTDSDEISLIDDDIDSRNKLQHRTVPPLPVIDNSVLLKQVYSSSKLLVESSSDHRSRGVINKQKKSITSTEEQPRNIPVSTETVNNGAQRFPSTKNHKGFVDILETHFTTNVNQQPQQSEELLLRPILSQANTPLSAFKRRALFHQQSSDPQSLPTTDETTTTTTTTATLETSCSTEIPAAYDEHARRKKKLLLQKQSSSFSFDNNDSSISSGSFSNNKNRKKRCTSHSYHGDYNRNKKINTITKDIVEFSIIDDTHFSTSKIDCHMPKNNANSLKQTTEPFQKCPSVILELPVINLPEKSDISFGSCSAGGSDLSQHGDKSQGSSCSEPILDPSLAGTSSRKWSKETLF